MGRKPTLLAQMIADRLGLTNDWPAESIQLILDIRARILKEEETARTVRPEPKERWTTLPSGERRLIHGD